MTSLKRFAGISAALTLAAVGTAAPSSAARPAQAGPPPASACTVVVGKAPEGEMSPVRSRICDTDPASPRLRPAAEDTLLMELNDNVDNNPPSVTRIYGEGGPCDFIGYSFAITGYWANRVSAFNTWNDCNFVTAYDLPDLTGDRERWSGETNPCVCVSVDWVGPFINDRIEAFQIWNG